MQSIGDRNVTTVPPQALAMMNSPLVRQLAEKFAKRIRSAPDAAPEQMVEQAYKVALSRPPDDSERAEMLGFIITQAASYGGNDQAMELAMVDFCQMMLCSNEFIFVD